MIEGGNLFDGIPADSRAMQDAIASPRLRDQLADGRMIDRLRRLDEIAWRPVMIAKHDDRHACFFGVG